MMTAREGAGYGLCLEFLKFVGTPVEVTHSQGFLLFHALVEEHVADFVHIKAEAERNRNQGWV